MSITATATFTSSLSDEYVGVETPPIELDESPITIGNARIKPHKHVKTVALEVEETVLGETITVMVPCLTWTPPSPSVSDSSLSIRSTPTVPTSPVSNSPEEPITWCTRDLLYLTSILKPDETASNTLVFTPSLEVLEAINTTDAIHLQLHSKTRASLPPNLSTHAYSKHAPIGTGRPSHRTLLASSHANSRSASAARRSLAHALLSDARAVATELDKCNLLQTLHRVPLQTLQSMLRAMHLMSSVPDAEWHGRLAQLRAGVDAASGVEARIEFFLLQMGRRALERWISWVNVCLEIVGERERRSCARVWREAARFLVRAYEEVGGY
ncbi:hypothetical protein ACJQWK_02056 [Exserohilum turcicum]|uniref:Uncharacterized protein n=1 Tax=Exserohilum turcicum (strain 28A) TaxID=671987 RepID=R0JYN3_EXST2|nr:uncharacterized protein SETTUDRAFT_28697 [Exserohilum turcica Et28A]EOA86008.1 hypothetical protein SETTUDRAFT_28697 [Exserohilum turcica Et28A]